MNPWQRLRLIAVIVALAATVWLGVRDGMDSLHGARGSLQTATAVTQILYGVLAVAALAALLARPRWIRPALAAWVAMLVLTGAAAPVVWGGADWWVGVLSAGVTLLLAGLVALGALAHVRGRGLR
ncbi:MAG TPA: hypothetical protein VLD58_06740 [Gemmatimonadales bacterium]|nr:hypothetical protein [Gemmatimonadales bacterium]